MKLRTSFFNGRVLLKNLTRFAPLWVLYAVAEVLCLLTMDLGNAGYIADDIKYIMGPVGIVHMVYAALVAACLFGDLFDSRLCNGLHAMPLRREGWLLTNLVSALLFALIPAIAGGLMGTAILGEFYYIAWIWQGVSLLQFVFFFGLAVFSAVCAGKRLGMIAIYGILNFLPMLVYWVATTIYEPLLYGVILSRNWFDAFCPVISFLDDSYIYFYSDKILGGFFRGFVLESWIYLYLCAGVGVFFTLLSWPLYRCRHLETAGDFISLRPMRAVFLVVYTFAMATLLFSFSELFGMNAQKDYGFLLTGVIIGWYTGWMLLERTAKVFKPKVLIGFLVTALLLAGSIGITAMDPLGIESYVPQKENVEYACLYPTNERFYYFAEEGIEGRHITDPEELEQTLRLHQQMIVTGEDADGETVGMEVRYQLKNGRYVCRTYNVPAASQVAGELEVFLSDMRSVFLTEDVAKIRETVNYAHVYLVNDSMQKDIEIRDPAQLQALLDAMEADCKAGTFAQHDYFHTDAEYVAGMDVTWQLPDSTGRTPPTRNKHTIIYSDCENLVAFLETFEEN